MNEKETQAMIKMLASYKEGDIATSDVLAAMKEFMDRAYAMGYDEGERDGYYEVSVRSLT